MAGDDVELKCMTFKTDKHVGVRFMYLCKNGIGVRMEKFSGSNGVDFKLSQVTQEDTGNYSCVYSEGRLVAHQITTIGQKHVFIQVKGTPNLATLHLTPPDK